MCLYGLWLIFCIYVHIASVQFQYEMKNVFNTFGKSRACHFRVITLTSCPLESFGSNAVGTGYCVLPELRVCPHCIHNMGVKHSRDLFFNSTDGMIINGVVRLLFIQHVQDLEDNLSNTSIKILDGMPGTCQVKWLFKGFSTEWHVSNRAINSVK